MIVYVSYRLQLVCVWQAHQGVEEEPLRPGVCVCVRIWTCTQEDLCVCAGSAGEPVQYVNVCLCFVRDPTHSATLLKYVKKQL